MRMLELIVCRIKLYTVTHSSWMWRRKPYIFQIFEWRTNYIFNFYSHAEKLVMIMPGIDITLASACMCTDRLLEVWSTLHGDSLPVLLVRMDFQWPSCYQFYINKRKLVTRCNLLTRRIIVNHYLHQLDLMWKDLWCQTLYRWYIL